MCSRCCTPPVSFRWNHLGLYQLVCVAFLLFIVFLHLCFSFRWSWWREPAASTWKPTFTPPTAWQFVLLPRATTAWTWWTWPTATPANTSQRWWSVRTSRACHHSTCAPYCPPASSTSTRRRRCITLRWSGWKQTPSTTNPGWTRSCLRLVSV